jgi:hypothetical protein
MLVGPRTTQRRAGPPSWGGLVTVRVLGLRKRPNGGHPSWGALVDVSLTLCASTLMSQHWTLNSHAAPHHTQARSARTGLGADRSKHSVFVSLGFVGAHQGS